MQVWRAFLSDAARLDFLIHRDFAILPDVAHGADHYIQWHELPIVPNTLDGLDGFSAIRRFWTPATIRPACRCLTATPCHCTKPRLPLFFGHKKTARWRPYVAKIPH
jgi:hypothetical protein